jgi:hypothetical protein
MEGTLYRSLFLIMSISAGVSLVSCRSSHHPARPSTPPPAPALPTTPGAPLPQGWIWPFDLAKTAFAVLQGGVLRPVDAARLAPYEGTGACTPAQVAPNLWFVPDCRPRVRAFSPPGVLPSDSSLPGALPASIDLRADGLDGPMKHQQSVGVCWSFAMSTVLENALRRAGRQEIIAPLHEIASDSFDEMWTQGSTRALVLESAWPYDPVKACKLNEESSERWCGEAYHVRPGSWREDPQLVAEVQQAHRSGQFRAVGKRRLRDSPADPEQIAATLAAGQAIFASFDYNAQAWGYKQIRDGVISDWTTTEGGHAVVLVGYRATPSGRQFLLHNSWGTDWAQAGYAWVSEAMVRMRITYAFTHDAAGPDGIAFPTTRRPTPNPTQTTLPSGFPLPFPFPIPGGGSTIPGGGSPVPGGCPAGQARDMIFGSCAAVCPAGSPRVAGLCPAGGQSPPSPAPSGGCAAGQVRDWLTGQCAQQCKNGLPPAGGVCMP